MQKAKIKVLFLCTGNSCRSQMAEGFARALNPDIIEAYSAGTKAKGLDPLALEVMKEAGIDISGQTSKLLTDLKNIDFDLVITVCDNAKESCPVFPAKVKLLHRSFQDPPELAKNAKSKEEALFFYRKVRDEIKSFVETLPGI